MPSRENDKLGLPPDSGWLSGRLLVASPGMPDMRFSRSVIYLCSHGPSGSMGLVVNRIYGELNFKGLLDQLNIGISEEARDLPVHFGGPVEPGRGFVLHSSDYERDGTTRIDDQIYLTATVEVLKELAEGRGPSRALLALGYAGWGAGQLDAELQTNGWLVAPTDVDIIFDPIVETKWDKALAKIGISPMKLSGDIGHA